MIRLWEHTFFIKDCQKKGNDIFFFSLNFSLTSSGTLAETQKLSKLLACLILIFYIKVMFVFLCFIIFIFGNNKLFKIVILIKIL